MRHKKDCDKMELCFFDAGIASVYAGREMTSDWGVRTSSWNAEVWAGKLYVCASFSERKVKRAARCAIFVAFAFGVGWAMDPPFGEAQAHKADQVIDVQDYAARCGFGL